ncbi:AEC family transporter [Pseudomonas benzenivorans]|uniref:AEC family transporter n=1 Tax=Pseudomonas benzenivorans TaxID=556533 RepID=A0ABY5H3D9_9PSED|nr:AEC family transporter [Pseudomonas benzenivorans]UTW06823.1 AEC family transporter [Pseudomonas benzenivorans]
MAAVFNVLLPIFALILAGYLCRRLGVLGPSAASEVNRMVVWLCLPALLFEATATADWVQIWQPQFILAYSLGALAVFVLTLLWRLRQRQGLADASVQGLSASYANTGYMGIPLCVLVLGDEGLEPALIASLIVVCVLFSLAVVCIEVALQDEKRLHRAVAKVLLALIKNPLVVAPLLGGLWSVFDQPLPLPAHRLLDLLAAATAPCALISLGLFLAHKQSGRSEGSIGLVLIKLIVHPLITWVLAFQVFQLPPLWAYAALLLSALPTGTGPFMLAEFYRREASVVSSSILLSTLGSLFSLSLCLYLIGQ